MEECFVMMPISDSDGYTKGHFKEVYESIIKPACKKAGYLAVRADDIKSSSLIMIEVLKKLLECPMAICDISSRNPNVLYELAIRQSFNKPVALIKDNITSDIFDIQGIKYCEYDHRLWHGSMEVNVSNVATNISETANNSDNSSLITLLGIKPA